MNPGDEQGYDTDERYGGTGQTRTRLPGDEDTYDTARRSMRPSRSLITVVGVVVLLIAAIAFANQNTDTPDNPSDARGPAASPTSPTGTAPVNTSTSGIPTGHPQTKQGAESAAANYAVALGSAEMFNKERRQAIVETVSAPDQRATLQTGFDADYSPQFAEKIGLEPDGSAPSGSTFVSKTLPAGTKVKAYSDKSATIDVWCSGLFGLAGDRSTTPVTASWFTVTVELGWTEDDWKVLSTEQKSGPTPVHSDSRVSGSKEIGSAVDEFGGFTYAR
ncbi:hypothetical protein ACWD44_24570 [Streptomyces albidoflavus]